MLLLGNVGRVTELGSDIGHTEGNDPSEHRDSHPVNMASSKDEGRGSG